MDTKELLDELNQDLLDSYNVVEQKGGQVPDAKNTNNLATAIDSIGDFKPPYDIPEFDGGEWGVVCYLEDGEIKYKTLLESDETPLKRLTNAVSSYQYAIFNDGLILTGDQILAYSFGNQETETNLNAKVFRGSAIPNFQNLYGLEKINTTSLPQYFLSNLEYFNQPITLPSTLTTINDYFLQSDHNFNQPLNIPDSVTTIKSAFMNSCYNFNQPIHLPQSIKTIAQSFMSNCFKFNQPIIFSNTTECSISNSFLNNCYSFNSPVIFENGINSLGTSFLQNCYKFNHPINLTGSYTTIGSDFLNACRNFNSSLTLSESCTTITDYFLHNCASFNQPLTLPSKVQSIATYFMYGCAAFNKPLQLPSSLTSINTYFMLECVSFNQPLDLPPNLTSIGDRFLNNAFNFTGPLNVGTASGFYAGNYTLSSASDSVPQYTTGITLTGTNAEGWKMGLPDRDSSPFRKLIVV